MKRNLKQKYIIQVKRYMLCIALFHLVFFYKASAQGNLMIYPMRVVFEGTKTRIVELNLANTGNDSAAFSISFSHLRMKENGGFIEITKPDSGQNFADNFIRFFPHTVKLGPKEAQTVKVQLSHISDLKPGEYRSHLYFRAIPNRKSLGDTANQIQSPKTFSVHITPVFGISIPVIVISGKPDVQVSLTDLSIKEEDKINCLYLNFNRTGNVSCYGHLSLVYVSPEGKEIKAGLIQGIAVYTPNKLRTAKIPITVKKGMDLHSGTLKVFYRAPEEKNNEILAQASISLH